VSQFTITGLQKEKDYHLCISQTTAINTSSSLKIQPFKFSLGFPHDKYLFCSVAYPGILFSGGSTNSVEDRGQRTGIWGQQPPTL